MHWQSSPLCSALMLLKFTSNLNHVWTESIISAEMDKMIKCVVSVERLITHVCATETRCLYRISRSYLSTENKSRAHVSVKNHSNLAKSFHFNGVRKNKWDPCVFFIFSVLFGSIWLSAAGQNMCGMYAPHKQLHNLIRFHVISKAQTFWYTTYFFQHHSYCVKTTCWW